MNFSSLRTYVYLRKWWKYAVTILVFLIIYLFVGDQSLLHFARRRSEIKECERQTRMYQQGQKEAEEKLKVLRTTEGLERYAREHYYMHNENEDIFLVEEE